jgi:O-antigen/teichoic acid export membrane protein
LRPFDSKGRFHAGTSSSGELRRLAVQGAGVSVFAQGVTLVVRMVSTVVLARILVPADFGVVAMVTTFSLLFTSFGGFTEAVIQRKEINRFLVSNLFWVCVGFGVLLTAGFAASGSLLARFYGNPEVVGLAPVLSLEIFISSTSVLHLALLKRAMLFTQVSANEIVAGICLVVVSISLAFAGWGYWALVAGILAYPLSRSIGAWMLCRWVPSLPRRIGGTGSMVRYSIHVYGRFNVEYMAHNMDNVLVGWRFGASSLGFYKKAYDLFALPANQLVRPLTAVAISALSRLKEDPERYKRYFLRALAVTAFLGMGLGADLTLVGRDLIRVLLGPQWEEAGRIFMFLGPGIGLMFIYATHTWIHLSIGSADRFFRWGIMEMIVTAVLFVVALPWGPEGIAVAWTVSYGILSIPAFWYAGRPIGFGVASMISSVWKYALASALTGCACLGLSRSVMPYATTPGAEGALARLLTDSLGFTALYLGTVILLYRGFEPLYQVGRILQEMVPAGRFSKPAPAVAIASGNDSAAVLCMAREDVAESGGR